MLKVISYCFVHPEYRRRGVGRMMMEWGLKIADAKQLDTWVESTIVGRALYESCGFKRLKWLSLGVGIDNIQNTAWPANFLPILGHVLSRPPAKKSGAKKGDGDDEEAFI